MKRFSSLSLCVAAVLSLAPVAVLAGGVECAIQLALESKSLLGTPVEAYHHRFTIRPVETTDVGKSTHTITGAIVHHNKTGKDDQVAYRIVKEKGAIKEAFVQVNDGEWEPLSPAMTAALGGHLKAKPMSKDERDAATGAMYEAGKGSWRNAVECLIARIAVLHC
jgi:hypothetical protein